jgi:hypothetical protein
MMKGGGRGRVNYAEAAIDIQACIDLIRGYISNNYGYLRRRIRVIYAQEGRACSMSVKITHDQVVDEEKMNRPISPLAYASLISVTTPYVPHTHKRS